VGAFGDEHQMPGDLKQYRRSALHCADMAQRAATPALATLLVELSKNWMKLANELERLEAFIDERQADRKDRA
jgi:hypothetical protein